MTRVLIVGPTPPPHLGLAIMLECLVKSDMRDVDLRHLRMVLSTHESQVGKFRWMKLARLLQTVARMVIARFVYRPHILYLTPAAASRTSMMRDIFILCLTRVLFPRTIFHYHSSGHSQLYTELTGWRRLLFRRAFFNAAAAVRISPLTPDDAWGLAAKREYIVPNGIDDPCAERDPCRTAVIATRQRPLQILFVALLCEGKGLLVLIEACGRLAARDVPFQANVMGRFESPEFEARVRRRIAELGIEQHVNFLGVLTGDEKFAAFRRADVFCHPTFFDTFPVVLLEAMACGLPVVATRWSGIPSIVDEGETGLLVEPHDPEAVADCLAELAVNPELADRLGQAGREKFLREFTLPRHIERMRQVFLEVGGQAPAAKVAHPSKTPDFVAQPQPVSVS